MTKICIITIVVSVENEAFSPSLLANDREDNIISDTETNLNTEETQQLECDDSVEKPSGNYIICQHWL